MRSGNCNRSERSKTTSCLPRSGSGAAAVQLGVSHPTIAREPETAIEELIKSVGDCRGLICDPSGGSFPVAVACRLGHRWFATTSTIRCSGSEADRAGDLITSHRPPVLAGDRDRCWASFPRRIGERQSILCSCSSPKTCATVRFRSPALGPERNILVVVIRPPLFEKRSDVEVTGFRAICPSR